MDFGTTIIQPGIRRGMRKTHSIVEKDYRKRPKVYICLHVRVCRKREK